MHETGKKIQLKKQTSDYVYIAMLNFMWRNINP
jgi:hypothetical protein